MPATLIDNNRREGLAEQLALWAMQTWLRPLLGLMAAPSFLFLAALTAMLLRHPDVAFYEIDRVAFVLLVLGVVGRSVILREAWLTPERATWPMLGLTLIALLSVIGRPFDNETWCLLAAKYIVPFTLFHLARQVFDSERRFKEFEVFALIVLAYLSFTAIAFMVGANSLIFPRFILDESLGHHADRARGPLLQAVADGVSLNLLGLLAVHAYRRSAVRGVKMALLLASVPFAILATMTRAVWFSFAGTLLALLFIPANPVSGRSSSRTRAWRLVCVGLVVGAGVVLTLAFQPSESSGALSERLEERGPIEYREAVYAGGWDMFLRHPLTGWGFNQMPAELPMHVSGYKENVLYPHNTYLELLVEHGVAGLALYLWLMWEMWRLGRGSIPRREQLGFLDHEFHKLWPVLLAVYWVNAAMVVMSYQFVNGLLFTMAGMLAAQRRRAQGLQSC